MGYAVRGLVIAMRGLAVGALALAAAVAYLMPDPARRLGLAGCALLAVAALAWALPWGRLRTAGVVVPLAGLGAGPWAGAPLDLGSDLSHHLATFPLLLLALLYAAAPGIPVRRAGVVVAAAYAAYAGPMLAGWLLGRSMLDIPAILTWHMGLVLCLAAGYAARSGYEAGRRAAPREAGPALNADAAG